MSFFIDYFQHFSILDIVDFFLVFVLFWYILAAIWRTTAFPVLIGLLAILLITVIATYLNLKTFSFVLSKIASILLIVVAILFPAEVRRGLYRLGQILPKFQDNKVEESTLDEVVNAVEILAREKIGALIVFKNKDEVFDLIKSGQNLDSEITEDLLYSIFQKNSPLHDGAVVIDKNRIVSAACYIPTITTEGRVNRNMGTRHRAALSFSQQSDALIVVVSEERGHISFAYQGVMETELSKAALKEKLLNNFLKRTSNEIQA